MAAWLQKLRYFDEAGEKNKKGRQSTKGAAVAQTERTPSYKEDQKMLEVVREVGFGPQIAWDKRENNDGACQDPSRGTNTPDGRRGGIVIQRGHATMVRS